MKLDCVLTAVNEKPLYLDFIPLFIKAWKKLYPNIDIKIILISNEIPTQYKEYEKNIILFRPIENISTNFISQYIRILFPCILNYTNGVMITDIDMIPMNRTYYTNNIQEYDNNKFIYYRENICFNYKQFAICYNVATPQIWNDIFKINSLENIKDRLINVYNNITYIEGHGKTGWSTDQLHLYKHVFEWNNKTNDFVCLKEKKTKFKRLDRIHLKDINNNIKQNILNELYTDYHCLRPYKQYKTINDTILDLL